MLVNKYNNPMNCIFDPNEEWKHRQIVFWFVCHYCIHVIDYYRYCSAKVGAYLPTYRTNIGKIGVECLVWIMYSIAHMTSRLLCSKSVFNGDDKVNILTFLENYILSFKSKETFLYWCTKIHGSISKVSNPKRNQKPS